MSGLHGAISRTVETDTTDVITKIDGDIDGVDCWNSSIARDESTVTIPTTGAFGEFGVDSRSGTIASVIEYVIEFVVDGGGVGEDGSVREHISHTGDTTGVPI